MLNVIPQSDCKKTVLLLRVWLQVDGPDDLLDVDDVIPGQVAPTTLLDGCPLEVWHGQVAPAPAASPDSIGIIVPPHNGDWDFSP